MVNILIDTQLVVAYYKEYNLGLSPDDINISGSTIELFTKISKQKDIIFVDYAGIDDNGKEKDGKIVLEWKDNVPKDAKQWFDTWLGTLLISGQIKYICISMDKSCYRLLELLHRRYNFPRQGSDKWYLRTAKSVANNEERGKIAVTIITEDLDFYDPNQKNKLKGEARLKFMVQQAGTIPPILAEEGIAINCVSIY
ncbi:MAG: hypothetical protein MUO30_05690 [Anaerolineales bacterium]|nr:hypothetical protein [Anaerolineales bacterium]